MGENVGLPFEFNVPSFIVYEPKITNQFVAQEVKVLGDQLYH